MIGAETHKQGTARAKRGARENVLVCWDDLRKLLLLRVVPCRTHARRPGFGQQELGEKQQRSTGQRGAVQARVCKEHPAGPLSHGRVRLGAQTLYRDTERRSHQNVSKKRKRNNGMKRPPTSPYTPTPTRTPTPRPMWYDLGQVSHMTRSPPSSHTSQMESLASS